MDQAIKDFANKDVNVRFTPHLLPMNRGMIATCHVILQDEVSVSDLRKTYEAAYRTEAFVHILDEGQVPQHVIYGEVTTAKSEYLQTAPQIRRLSFLSSTTSQREVLAKRFKIIMPHRDGMRR